MIEEPYRWIDAVANRREYISDQLKEGTPVFALSRPEGIFLLGAGAGHSKVFEIYNRHAMAALGHPVDIEKLRQAAIEAAHMEGFNRSPADVTLRRLVNFALSPTLKNAFEQVHAPPLIVESLFAECGATPQEDLLVRLHFDGRFRVEEPGVCVVHVDGNAEEGARSWLQERIRPEDPLRRVRGLCLLAWNALVEEKNFSTLVISDSLPEEIEGKELEMALLDRNRSVALQYQPLDENAEILKA
ncbi:MAG: hypothetical protein WD490_02200 [Opitutales bacterium]